MATVDKPFESFGKIERLAQPITITEKVHGSNAQVFITEDGAIQDGSRTRWITPEDDNYGFDPNDPLAGTELGCGLLTDIQYLLEELWNA